MKIEEQLLTHKTIFLNLSLKERATGLDEIVKDLSSFYLLPVYFWNLSQSTVSKIRLKEERRLLDRFPSQIHSRRAKNIEAKKNTVYQSLSSTLTRRLQDRPVQNEALANSSYQIQSFENIISTLISLHQNQTEGIFVIENIDRLISSESLDVFQYEQLKTWIVKLTQKSRQRENFYLIILGSSDRQWELEDIAPKVKLPYLSHKEIAVILKRKFARLKLKDSDKEELLQKAGHILSGLSRPELLWGVDNITNSLTEDRSAQAYIDKLLEYKQNMLQQLGLSFLPPPEIGEIGGMDLLKEAIDKLEIEFTADRNKYDIPETDGWVMVGVPGVGKSLSAKVIQAKLALPMVHIPAEKVKENGPGYLARILELCEANAPVIVYFDELEKIFPEGNLQGNEASTLGVFLTWLQEKEASCFVLATLNRLDTLPPELIRAGRFSEVWYVGFPQPNERREIFNLYLRRYDPRYIENDLELSQWKELIDESIRFTGAEIAQVVKKSYRQKVHERIESLDKLKSQMFQKLEQLTAPIKQGYQHKMIEDRDRALDFTNLDRTVSKVMAELGNLPAEVEKIDRLYGQFVTKKCQDVEFSTLKKNLKQTIYSGYAAMIDSYEPEIISIDNLDSQISQILLDLAEHPQQVEQIEQLYLELTEVREQIDSLDSQPLTLDYDTLLKFTLEETPLFERAVEKVMAIENRARKICRPVASKDESDLIDSEPSFWVNMRESEALEIINEIRGTEAQEEGVEYTPSQSIEEAELEAGSPEYNAAYWAF